MLFLLLFSTILGSNCEKNLTDETDITKYSWKLVSITTKEESLKPDNKHILEFPNDSIFYLNLSVNSAGGKYKILSKGEIKIYSYNAFTEICCDDTDIDYALLNILPTITSYQVLNNTLIFKGASNEVEFNKEN